MSSGDVRLEPELLQALSGVFREPGAYEEVVTQLSRVRVTSLDVLRATTLYGLTHSGVHYGYAVKLLRGLGIDPRGTVANTVTVPDISAQHLTDVTLQSLEVHAPAAGLEYDKEISDWDYYKFPLRFGMRKAGVIPGRGERFEWESYTPDVYRGDCVFLEGIQLRFAERGFKGYVGPFMEWLRRCGDIYDEYCVLPDFDQMYRNKIDRPFVPYVHRDEDRVMGLCRPSLHFHLRMVGGDGNRWKQQYWISGAKPITFLGFRPLPF